MRSRQTGRPEPDWETRSLIAAEATAAAKAGLAVIRLCGEGAIALADRVFIFGPIRPLDMQGRPLGSGKPGGSPADFSGGTSAEPGLASDLGEPESPGAGRRSLLNLAGYQAAYGHLREPETGRVIDEAVVLIFRRPHSYTGEETVEFSVHGGRVSVRRLLETLYRLGARAAEPGELTRRAFMNGKLDLAQAEAVAELIQAESLRGQELALSQLSGQFSAHFAALRQRLYQLVAELEVGIEYPEHEDFDFEERILPERLEALNADLEVLCSSYRQGRASQEGLRVLLTGEANAGKSSLLNYLSRRDLAIVTDIPGTTRDLLESRCHLGGVSVRLTDTAGLRESADPVERIGIARAREAMAEADYVLRILDPEQLRSLQRDQEARARLQADLEALSCPYSLVLNKQDLCGPADEEALHRALHELLPPGRRSQADNLPEPEPDQAAGRAAGLGGKPEIPETLLVSAHSGYGMADLEAACAAVYETLGGGQAAELILHNERHYALVLRALDLGRQLLKDLPGLPLDICSQGLQRMAEILAELSGEAVHEAVLDELFSRFCVGK